MSSSGNPLSPERLRATAAILAALGISGLGLAAPAHGAGPESALATIRPDYRTYVGEIRPLAGEARSATAVLYMALVRPGASDPSRRENAPFLGPGARNDILYDPTLFESGGSPAWVMLLLDHEYFHARHLAGATSLPAPARAPAAMERHFYEAAAWGFNVAQARSGRYPGLTETEFREALDRYGEHYRALRALTQDGEAPQWDGLQAQLRDPEFLLTTSDSPGTEAPARPSDPGLSPAIP